MKQAVLKLYNGFSKTKTGIFITVLALYLALVLFGGGSVLEVGLFWLTAVFYIALPGALAQSVLKKIGTVADADVPLSILYGSGFFAVVYCVGMRLGILWLTRFVPPLLAVIYIFLLWKNGTFKTLQGKVKTKISPSTWLLILLFSALLLLYTFAGVAKNALPTSVGDVLLNQDMLWNIGNANSFKIAFPPQDIRFYNVRLHYHYLTELLAGALSLVSGISAYNIVAFYMQPAVLLVLVLCLHAFAKVYWPESALRQILFPYSFFLFSCASLWAVLPGGLSLFWNNNITHLITNINSQATAVIFLCVFLVLLVPAMRAKWRVNALYFVVMLLAIFMLCFAKGPLAAIVILSLLCTVLLALPFKNSNWRGVLFGAAAAGLFAFVYTAFFSSGANTSMPLVVYGTLEKGAFMGILTAANKYLPAVSALAIPLLYIVQSFAMLPAQFPLFLRALARDVRHFNLLPPERMLAYGSVLGGLLAYFLFNHPSLSQVYFLFTAVFFINLIAVDSISFLKWPREDAKKAKMQRLGTGFVAVFAALGFATAGFLYVHHIGSGARQIARNTGLIEKYPYTLVVNADDVLAAQWLRENTETSAMFATNRIHSGSGGGISNLYSALGARQGFMEGYTYAVTNMGVSQPVVNARIRANTALFTAGTSQSEIARICSEHGIDYFVFSTQLEGSCEALAHLEEVFSSPTVKIFKVPSE